MIFPVLLSHNASSELEHTHTLTGKHTHTDRHIFKEALTDGSELRFRIAILRHIADGIDGVLEILVTLIMHADPGDNQERHVVCHVHTFSKDLGCITPRHRCGNAKRRLSLKQASANQTKAELKHAKANAELRCRADV